MDLQNNGYRYVGNKADGNPLNGLLEQEINEYPLHRRMRKNYRYFGGLSVLYGLVFTFCLYKNLHGSTFPICVGATIGFSVMLLHKIDFKLVRQSVPYMTGMILLGISTAYTSSFFFHFFNIFGIILLFCVFMIRQFYNDHTWNFPGYLERIIILMGTTAECLQYPIRHGISHW